MSRGKAISVEGLSRAISEELGLYADSIRERVDAAGAKAVKKLVKETRETAPKGGRASKKYADSISSTTEQTPSGSRHIWYVKAPNHRLTHLLVHGHATVKGGRTKGNHFLHDALDHVLPEYEAAVEEAVKHD